jgi:hypothetical protein
MMWCGSPTLNGLFFSLSSWAGPNNSLALYHPAYRLYARDVGSSKARIYGLHVRAVYKTKHVAQACLKRVLFLLSS